MLEARALFYALVLMLFVTSISGLLVSYANINHVQQIDQFQKIQARCNIQSGIALLKSGLGDPEGQWQVIGQNENNQVYLARFDWGLLDIGIVKAPFHDMIGPDTLSKVLALGNGSKNALPSAIYLPDGNAPLSLAGTTNIRGNCYLPKLGLKTTTVAGSNFRGEKPKYTQIKTSGKFLPKIDMNRISKIQEFLKSIEANTISTVHSDSIHRSFEAATLHLTGSMIALGDIFLGGKIMISSVDSILVQSSAHLENLILFAPTIIFESGFKGTCQVFASKNIRLEEKVTLNYPSALNLLTTENSHKANAIFIGNSAFVSGSILVKTLVPSERKPKFYLAPEAIFEGQAYVNGYSEIRGTIYGQIATDQFILNTGGSIYTNHLLDATINRSSLHVDYLPLLLNQDIESFNIAAWLD